MYQKSNIKDYGCLYSETLLKHHGFVIVKVKPTVFIIWNEKFQMFGNVWLEDSLHKIKNIALYLTSAEDNNSCTIVPVSTELELCAALSKQAEKTANPSAACIDFGIRSTNEILRKGELALFYTVLPPEIKRALSGSYCEAAYNEYLHKPSNAKTTSLIVLEGIDGVGKQTQAEMLVKDLKDARLLSFPNYDSESSSLIKMYLQGTFGKDPDVINPYTVSTFFAVDRAASLPLWIEDYKKGKKIVANRYTTSNLTYQMAKLPQTDWNDFLAWEEDLEYKKMKIPKPDIVFFLDISENTADELLRKRYQNGSGSKDIHEMDREYQRKCREAALYVSKKEGWKIISCEKGDKLESIEEIHKTIMKILLA